jgi:hypothetical protein
MGAGCVTEPATEVCPIVVSGDLVVTEIRGAQSGADTYGQWIEIYNATGRELDLRGLHLSFRRIDGGAEATVIVRKSVVAAPRSYVVIGKGDTAIPRPHVDYSMGTDFAPSWFAAAAIEVSACGDLIDQTTYSTLPTTGTWSLGTMPPTSTANDDPTMWCADQEAGGPTTELGIRGTPRESNRPCS